MSAVPSAPGAPQAPSGEGAGAAGAGVAGAEPAWRRLHPVTPVLRSWRVMALLLVLYAQQRGGDVVQHAGRGRPGHTELLYALGALVAVVVVAITISALAWRVTVYAVDAESVRLHSGLLFRRQRAARLDRVQAVDVVQPLLARLLGFAEVKIEVAGGSGSDVRLAYLREADAQRLRGVLLARSAGLAFDGEDAPQASEATVVEVPTARVAASLALGSGIGWLVLLLAVLVASAVWTHSLAPLLGAFPALVGLVTALWAGFSSAASWRVAVAGDGLRLRHGLLATQTQTVLPGRVQAVRLSQPLLWRLAPGSGPDRGWWRVHANVAGYGRDRRDRRSGEQHLLLPVATRAEAEAVLALLLPTLAAELGSAGLGAGLTGLGPGSGAAGARAAGGGEVARAGGADDAAAEWVVSPRRARLLDPVSWRRHGALVLPAALLLRRGRLRRELDVVPHERTQSLALVQGPLQRRLGLAGFVVHSTRGPVRPGVAHLREADALALLADQAARARRARAAAGPERWMERGPAVSP